MNHLQNKTRKANGLRQFSNLDVNIAVARDHTLIDLPGPRLGTAAGENHVNLPFNLRTISKEFAPIRFMQD
jgi:hypothetical protein